MSPCAQQHVGWGRLAPDGASSPFPKQQPAREKKKPLIHRKFAWRIRHEWAIRMLTLSDLLTSRETGEISRESTSFLDLSPKKKGQIAAKLPSDHHRLRRRMRLEFIPPFSLLSSWDLFGFGAGFSPEERNKARSYFSVC